MVGEVLKIKTKMPPLAKSLLPRPGILEYLEDDLTVSDGFARPLTLVSAPAGFGKTSLACLWLHGHEYQTAWFSLDAEDNDLDRFWIYLISALQNVIESLGSGSLEILRSNSLADTDGLQTLAPLLNDLYELSTPLFLVLDDYHVIDNPKIHEGLAILIENLPPSLHLVVTTRSDPPWPLFRWRAKGQMAEVRLNDLEFSQQDAQQFLENKGIELNENQLDGLCQRTEGWITGLQLAAFSLSKGVDIDQCIENFTGSHRHILDFLEEEVYGGQSQSTKEFLLKTSVLNRLCGPLCDSITGGTDSTQILVALERENIFVIPLDDEGEWFRYHHLFSDFLRGKLKKELPQELPRLHLKASDWYLQFDEFSEALTHSFSCQSPDKVARLINDHFHKIFSMDGPGQLLTGFQQIPLDLLKRYPRLLALRAFYQVILKGREGVEEYLQLAEGCTFSNPQEQQEFNGILATIRTNYYINTQNFPQALEYAKLALDLLPQEASFWRMGVAILMGDAKLFSGRPDLAYPYYLEAYQNNRRLKEDYFTISTGLKLGINLSYLGRLKDAEYLTLEVLRIAKEAGFGKISKVGVLWTLLGDFLREKGNFAEAERCVERGLLLSEPVEYYLAWNSLYKVALSFSKKDYPNALDSLHNIDALFRSNNLPVFVSLAATIWKARVLAEMGEYLKSTELLTKLGINKDGEVQPGNEKGYLVLSRILLAQDQDLGLVGKILVRLEETTRSGEHTVLLLETLLLKATLEEKLGNPQKAEETLKSALRIGHGSGFFQLFVDEGKQLGTVFSRLSPTKGLDQDYLRNINQQLFPNMSVKSSNLSASIPVLTELTEELSPRELEILELINLGLSNQEISDKLYLSLGTVKWHTSNIYGKLGVRGRTQALALAKKLNILV